MLGLTVTVLTVPTYRAESSIQIDQQASRVLDAPDIEPVQAVQDADRFLQTQTEILRSRALAIRVAETLGLFGGNGFLEAMHVKPLSGAMGTLGAGEAHREQVIAVLRDNLSITLPDGSRVARIAFDSPDPAMAAKVANAFANTMISSNLSRRFDTSVYARQFLREQLEQAKERLEESERSMVGYARSSGIIDTDAIREAGSAASGAPSLVASSLIESNDALSQARSRRIDAEQLWTTTRSAPLMSLPEVLSNPAIQTMMERARNWREATPNKASAARTTIPTSSACAARSPRSTSASPISPKISAVRSATASAPPSFRNSRCRARSNGCATRR
ncbi:hypothetical protein ADT71_00715 [Novosphingobium sp. ST904]|nr:hypothetical protein ADT71_00715 [Novosphingobium sp. ST904]